MWPGRVGVGERDGTGEGGALGLQPYLLLASSSLSASSAWFFGRGSCRGAGGGGLGALLSATRPGGDPPWVRIHLVERGKRKKKKYVGWVGARNE